MDESERISDEAFRDLLLPLAAKIIMETQNSSIIHLQRLFGIGYAASGRLIDTLEERGMLGSWDHKNPREILFNWNQFEEMFGPVETITVTHEIYRALEQRRAAFRRNEREVWRKYQEEKGMSYYYVIGVRMDNRVGNAANFQQVLTKNGCKIKARLGLHEVSEDLCATDGLIILQPYGEKDEIEALVAELNALAGIKAKLIDLN